MRAVALWLRALARHRAGRLIPAVLGVSMTIALLGVLGIFINASAATMTRRALGDVPVDWQVEVASGGNTAVVGQQLRRLARVRTVDAVGYATVPGFSATAGGTTQTTGEGKVLGISSTYWKDFPGELRPMLGRSDGVLIAQQTAANLHVSVGDSVAIMRPALPPVHARVDGVIDLPQADALFQAVGVPPSAAPQAPPDNVLVIPDSLWLRWFDPVVALRPDAVRTQLHVRLSHDLPPDPRDAYVYVQQLANNFEARVAGSAVVGNNLGARLDGVREDALYARVLFLFLGLPGAILAIVLTFAVASTGDDRRRREQALLRTRGASTTMILRLESVEGVLVAAVSVVIALFATQIIVRQLVTTSTRQLGVLATALAIGVATALAALILPAWRTARSASVRRTRARVGRARTPFWEKTWIDVILLLVAGAMYWRAAASGYQIVLAPEGVAQTSVSYESFIAPLALWIGVGLLVMRVFRHGLIAARGVVARVFQPLAGNLSPVVAASMARQSRLVTRGIVLVTLAFSFAVSTAVFNTTYNVQSRVDAALTNGSDVTVTGSTAYPAGALLNRIARVPGVRAARAMNHRFAYVGNDLQDIFGVDPLAIADATDMADAYFANNDARASLRALATHRDGVLVSQETVNDFQLHVGDEIALRLQSARDHQYHPVKFHFLGVVREFPTAPKDSFILCNADYLADATGDNAREVVLLRSAVPADVLARRIAPITSTLPGARVTDLGSVMATISSSLTSVDLRGLTWIELSFAILLIAAASGLILGIGLVERRRDFALLAALGATTRQLGAFLWAEGLLILVAGMVLGSAAGFGLAKMLVKVLTGVFDPPPQGLSVSWSYLAVLLVAGGLSTVLAVLAASRVTRRRTIEALRTI